MGWCHNQILLNLGPDTNMTNTVRDSERRRRLFPNTCWSSACSVESLSVPCCIAGLIAKHWRSGDRTRWPQGLTVEKHWSSPLSAFNHHHSSSRRIAIGISHLLLPASAVWMQVASEKRFHSVTLTSVITLIFKKTTDHWRHSGPAFNYWLLYQPFPLLSHFLSAIKKSQWSNGYPSVMHLPL